MKQTEIFSLGRDTKKELNSLESVINEAHENSTIAEV